MALTPDFLSSVDDPVTEIWEEFELKTLEELALRILHADYDATSTAIWQYTKLKEMRLYEDYLQSEIAKYLKISKSKVKEIMDEAVRKSLGTAKEIIDEAAEKGLVVTDGYLFHPDSNVVKKGSLSVYHEIKNWTKSYYSASSRTLEKALDLAYLRVSSGLMSDTEAVDVSINDLAKNGVVARYARDGRKEQIRTVVARAVRTGVNITTGKIMTGVCDDLNCDLVQTSQHQGARPSHAVWQGDICSRSGTHPNYPDFYKHTSFGQIDGLCGINCRHTFYPYFEGLSSVEKTQTYMSENERKYKLEQAKNKAEREEHELKKKIVVLKTINQQPHKLVDKVNKQSNEGILSLSKNIKDITNEYIKNSQPGIGKVIVEDGVYLKSHQEEIKTAEWLVDTFGGDVTVLKEVYNIKTPVFLWNNQKVELKNVSSDTSIDKRIQKALKQIENQGVVIIELINYSNGIDKAQNQIIKVLSKRATNDVCVILKKEMQLIKVYKYKK